ncbi:YdiU family protein [Vibrio sp. SM6]|uniref:Protein nucleotidyltransferase YdiU n=1 Tax=Vibrio agarilyticus TaxID=2726741 RepID=A0A7X8TTB5_9VIBR|nr:YdiU family protein [Vibrio agarilyticus]NLS14510.1 YdiU family protein [Vibrio agarilyticus]
MSQSESHSNRSTHGKTIDIGIDFDHSYATQLFGFYQNQRPDEAPDPQLIAFNHRLAGELNIQLNNADEEALAHCFSGNALPKGANPIALAYAGHQFGHYTPQLGDGRALLIGEAFNRDGARYDIQLKGSGRTAFSRSGDGKAALGPVLREYLVSEAMHALGVPTTRALAAVTTGERIIRRQALDQFSIGAILTRTAASHIRVGTFQFFAHQGELNHLRQLADYVIARHYPNARDAKRPYLTLLSLIAERQAALVAAWQCIGFIHGVMNTDNTAVSGETIDYGPCAFIDRYDPDTVFSSIDSEGRYAYKNQPYIAQWNLARLAETLLPLIDQDEAQAIDLATDVVHQFMPSYQTQWVKQMRIKLGLTDAHNDDAKLAHDLLQLFEAHQIDFTQGFRALARTLNNDLSALTPLFTADSSSTPNQLWLNDCSAWHARWLQRLAQNPMSINDRSTLMDNHNPIYIPRNHLVEQAIFAAETSNDFAPFKQLLALVTQPFIEKQDCEDFAKPAPASFSPYQTFCGT